MRVRVRSAAWLDLLLCGYASANSRHQENHDENRRSEPLHIVTHLQCSPKIVSCLLLATNTSPFATTGTMLAFPPTFGQLPAVA